MIDNFGQQAVAAQFSDIVLGPGNVNFTPRGLGVNLTDSIARLRYRNGRERGEPPRRACPCR